MTSTFNTLDLAFIVIIGISILLGVLKGFIRELFSLAFFLIAVILSFLFYTEAGAFFIKYFKNKDISNFAGFISIFCFVLIVGALVTFFIKKIFTIGPLKAVDRILGGAFGLVRGILISGIIVFGFMAFKVNEQVIVKSTLAPYLVGTIKVFYSLLPKEIKENTKYIKTI